MLLREAGILTKLPHEPVVLLPLSPEFNFYLKGHYFVFGELKQTKNNNNNKPREFGEKAF